MPAEMPKIRIVFECFPLFEVLSDLELEDLCAGAATGSETTMGAVNKKKMLSFDRMNETR